MPSCCPEASSTANPFGISTIRHGAGKRLVMLRPPSGIRDPDTNAVPPERAAPSVVVTANPRVAIWRPRVALVAIIAVGAVSQAYAKAERYAEADEAVMVK